MLSKQVETLSKRLFQSESELLEYDATFLYDVRNCFINFKLKLKCDARVHADFENG